jgi:hypothetical protein
LPFPQLLLWQLLHGGIEDGVEGGDEGGGCYMTKQHVKHDCLVVLLQPR